MIFFLHEDSEDNNLDIPRGQRRGSPLNRSVLSQSLIELSTGRVEIASILRISGPLIESLACLSSRAACLRFKHQEHMDFQNETKI
jgi:hypothetical protein